MSVSDVPPAATTDSNPRESWGSRFGFIMATAGFAVGLGAIWRFPYLVSENGGGAFVLVYIVISVLVGIPLFIAELMLGRRTQKGPILGMRELTRSGNPFRAIGWLGTLSALLIMSYYVVILGFMVGYFVMSLTGTFSAGTTAEQISTTYSAFTANTPAIVAATVGIIAVTGLIISRGLKEGIERSTKFLMPLLLILLIGLTVYSLLQPGAAKGVAWYLTPDFSLITGEVILAALGQAFFAIGIGVATAFIFGSYLDREKSQVPGDSVSIVGVNTLIAILAGLIIFPAIRSYGLTEAEGPGLVFQTMPNVFARIPGGFIVGPVFFLLVLIAGLTSAIGYSEGIAGSLRELTGWSRRRASWATVGAILVLAVPSMLSYGGNGPLSDVIIAGKNLFTWADFISGSILMPLGALLIIVFVALFFGFNRYREEANRGAGAIRVQGWWKPLVVVVIPLAVAVIMVTGLLPQ
ncbi:NSS family neurotransmitter:Na+ symporter [Halopolyspora algeriensis]|uniref:Transporter n=1 Tax=Halopolyspora algeriensis TaxID=1500506 RepID=A0A368VJ39_9ACTN|nr:sodium-dependent transporter [Halopolyspora algeriensis]RCW40745.1 NSS family neurotransmitter:Na+ symporter [Halopolyspora algeriensis]TQM53336.1 NSS family neurotransmitter:Na+ symporter [Halopolyspora algeriensis]